MIFFVENNTTRRSQLGRLLCDSKAKQFIAGQRVGGKLMGCAPRSAMYATEIFEWG
jgi:hypothetical protein